MCLLKETNCPVISEQSFLFTLREAGRRRRRPVLSKRACSSSSATLPAFTVSPLVSRTSWASKDVVWSNMLEKDKAYTRDVRVMEKHPHLQPKMRAILLDWLMEVCGPALFLFL